MNNPNINNKEFGLIKGALRRVFSRSELREAALSKHDIDYHNPDRPRVTRWSFCGECGVITPRYQIEIDHLMPIIGTTETLMDLSVDELVNRIWCPISNLMPKCPECHLQKTSQENQGRSAFKKLRKKK